MLSAINPVPTVASFHTSNQPLSAPHTRVAHSFHLTFHHYNSFAIDAHTEYPHLVDRKITKCYASTSIQLSIKKSFFNIPFHSIATLAFPDHKAKNHANPAVNGSCLLPSFFGLLQPPPLLHSQAARIKSYALVYLRFAQIQLLDYKRKKNIIWNSWQMVKGIKTTT